MGHSSNKRPYTVVVDIDGCIFEKHAKTAREQWFIAPEVLPGVHDAFSEWEKAGATIILMTARRESMRSMTEVHLRRRGLFWDHLIMGVATGSRYIINDRNCQSFTLKPNEGLEDVRNCISSWERGEDAEQVDASHQQPTHGDRVGT